MKNTFKLAFIAPLFLVTCLSVYSSCNKQAVANQANTPFNYSIGTPKAPLNIDSLELANYVPPVSSKELWDNPKADKWADSLLKTMTPDERLGQLFMIAAYSNRDETHQQEIASQIKKYGLGGLIFMQGNPLKEAAHTNYYQSVSKIPLMLSIDGEWGLAMRLDSVQPFPKQMTLGAIQNDTLIYEMGRVIGKQCKRLGVHINFAPDIDVNNNPANPVINMRSFGENKYNVARKGIAYTRGMQEEHILACGKHFPGHGDTDTDSHHDLPRILHSRRRLDSLELYPFHQLIKAGVGSMMIAHLSVPALDNTPNQATTLSPKVVQKLLKDEMKFKGLIFTDALNMKGVAKYYQPGEVDLMAFKAGNDVLLFSENVGKAFDAFHEAIASKSITQLEIDARCRKILHTKYWLGLHSMKEVNKNRLTKDINIATDFMNKKLYKAAITIAHDPDNTLPLHSLDKKTIASVAIGATEKNIFQNTLDKYAPIQDFQIAKDGNFTDLKEKLKNYNTIIIGVQNPGNKLSKNAVFNASIISFINSITATNKTVVVTVFGNPYSVENLTNIAAINTVVMSYEDNQYTQQYSAEAIFGGIAATGKLPVTIPRVLKEGSGKKAYLPTRLQYVTPDEMGIQQKRIRKIDSIVNYAIEAGAMPGAQVLLAKDGKVFYNKDYGYYTYNNVQKVDNTTMYDIASITKLASSTLLLMKLQDEGKVNLSTTLGELLPALKNTNKGDLTIKEVFTHQAGLPAWIPFFNKTVDEKRNMYYASTPSAEFPINVAKDMYLRKDYIDTIMYRIDTCVLKEKKYVYSDLGYYYLKQYLEQHYKASLDKIAASVYYQSLGATRITYNPLANGFLKQEIAPTENDVTFRNQLLQGYVHDQGAAMLGGVGGHAGLFSDANSLAIIFQMLLNKGSYGGVKYLSPSIIEQYTSYQSSISRRGICFDKPEKNPEDNKSVPTNISTTSFGHTGFTGTIVWANPKDNSLFIFLSNRVCPNADNKKLLNMDIRPKLQTVFESMMNDVK